MLTVLMQQPAGFGDIMFCLKIASKYVEECGAKVIWPVINEYIWIKDYVHLNGVEFCSIYDDFEYKNLYNSTYLDVTKVGDCIVIPLQAAWNKYKDGKIMEAKYRIVGMDSRDWHKYFTFTRNRIKENELFVKLGLFDEMDYVLVNKKYASPPNTLIYDKMIVPSNKHIVEVDYVEGYNMFDWSKVIENASEIHMVDSGFNYIIDKLTLKTNKLYLYPRWGKLTEFELSGLFKTKWIMQNGTDRI